MRDAAYFIAGAPQVEDRREHEEDLSAPTTTSSLDARRHATSPGSTCWEELPAPAASMQIVMVIAPAMVVERTDRGDDMFMAVLARDARRWRSTSTRSTLLPEPGDGGRRAAAPGARRRGPPRARARAAVERELVLRRRLSDDGSLGVYHRLGRLPNAGVVLYSARASSGPASRRSCSSTRSAPLPPTTTTRSAIETDAVHAEQHCEAPLERFRVVAGGTARRLRRPLGAAAQGAGRAGRDRDRPRLGDRRHRRTSGGMATRYEIPCRVTGTVTIGGETIELSGPGQRDHSWGARDWWAIGLDVERACTSTTAPTRTPSPSPRIPDFGVGYVQQGERASPRSRPSTSATEVADNGLITSSARRSAPGRRWTLDGRAARVRRAPARGARRPRLPLPAGDGAGSTAADGRNGLGWMEWNRNQRAELSQRTATAVPISANS